MTFHTNPQAPLNTAVLLLIFNRPATTEQVFEAIRKARPPRIYVASDGPRDDRTGEAEKVEQARNIATQVDWPCEVKTLFRSSNLGCKYAVSEAITWFFEYEEQGIILEDDCLPHQDFFGFCDELLVRYADDERIAMINGNNFQNGQIRGEGSYYFSKQPYIWGWASWRRAWANYQLDLPFWPQWKVSEAWKNKMPDAVERRYWTKILESAFKGQIDTWDYSWAASLWYHGGLSITPNVNLVSNIGFGEGATHTTNAASRSAGMEVFALGQLRHPQQVLQDAGADRYGFDYHFEGRKMRLPRSMVYLPIEVAVKIYRLFRKKFST